MSSDETKSSSPQFITRLIKTETEHGKLTNGYRTIRELGEGAYAQVKLCELVETGKYYAMKKMSKRTLTKQREYGVGPLGRSKITTALDKVQREIALMTSCRHPSIVPLIAVIDDPDEDPLMLILEYADKGQIMDWDGNTLTYKSKLYPTSATGGLPESVIRRIMHDVVDGLEYLHEKRIIHRDIKPENLLMFSSGITKICDFGVARSFTEQEDGFISDTHGTYHFFAPEMCTGEKFSGYKADIWSLGVTLFIMTFGSLPYTSKDNNPAELFENIGKKDLEFPDVPVSPDLRDLLNHILDKDPGKRYELAQIRQHRWMQTKDTETSTSTSTASTSSSATSTSTSSSSSTSSSTTFPSAPKAPSTGSYIVVLHSHATDADIIALEHAIATSGGHIKHRYTTALRGVAGDMSQAQVKLLETHPLVNYVEADGVVTTQTDGPM